MNVVKKLWNYTKDWYRSVDEGWGTIVKLEREKFNSSPSLPKCSCVTKDTTDIQVRFWPFGDGGGMA